MGSKKRYEAILPIGYHLHKRITPRRSPALSVLSFGLLGLSMLLLSLFLIGRPLKAFALTAAEFFIGYGVFFLCSLLYFLLYELVRGASYLFLCGKRPTLRIRLHGIYCASPDVYLYRPYALATALVPFVLLSLLFIPLLSFTFYLHPMAYLAAAFMFGIHLGSCVADLYVAYLLIRLGEGALVRHTEEEFLIYR